MGDKFSPLDLVDQDSENQGLIMKTKRQNINAIDFHPDEAELHSPEEDLGNSFTRSAKLDLFRRIAFGIPLSSVPGQLAYNEAVGESGHDHNDIKNDFGRGFLYNEDDVGSEPAWPKQSDAKDSSINNDNKKEDYINFIQSEMEEVNSEDQKNIEALASTLESLGYNKEAAEIRKVAIPWVGLGIAAAIIGVISAIAGIYDYATQDVDPAIAKRMEREAKAFANALDKIDDNLWGAKLDPTTIEAALVRIKKDPNHDFKPLYKEVARVLAGQDVEADWHLGSWGRDQGDFGYFEDLDEKLVEEFKGKVIGLEDLRNLLESWEPAEAWVNWGGETTWEYSKDEIENYVEVWNTIVAFETALRESGKRLRESMSSFDPEKAAEEAEEQARIQSSHERPSLSDLK